MNLPPIPPELKTITPYLQRSDELAAKDPVMSYWCAYYAAQVGIALKPKDHASRSFLFDLLGILEHMKAAVGSNDAIEDESAASAYVENFALKLFGLADNEDRLGEATRKTAKKFLAAANFFEILRTFEKPDLASIADNQNEEKIRYAKWKAADIAKAFREGRKPTPGPAGHTGSPSPEPAVAPSSSQPTSSPSTPSLQRAMPPPPSITDMPPPQQDGFFPHTPPTHGLDVQSPGRWSTVATPGTPGGFIGGHHQGLDSNRSRVAKAQVSEELEDREDGEKAELDEQITPRIDLDQSPNRKEKGVRFTPSVVGGISTAATTSAVLGSSPSVEPNPFATESLPSPMAPELSPPSGFAPEVVTSEHGTPPVTELPPGFVPSPTSTARALHPDYEPQFVSPVPPPQAPSPIVLSRNPPLVNLTATAIPVELTPVEIARAQKRCRFAISALDYEDVDQARMELRAALKLLGG